MTNDFLIGAIRASRDLHPQVKTELEEILAEPRVMTLEEIQKLQHRAVVWEEVRGYRAVCPMIVSRDNTLIDEDGETEISAEMMKPLQMFIGPPRLRRYWSGRPTPDQRKAVPWG